MDIGPHARVIVPQVADGGYGKKEKFSWPYTKLGSKKRWSGEFGGSSGVRNFFKNKFKKNKQFYHFSLGV